MIDGLNEMAERPVKCVLRSRIAANSGYPKLSNPRPFASERPMSTSVAGSATPTRGRSRKASARLKIAALAAMPMASDRIEVAVKIGLRASSRMA